MWRLPWRQLLISQMCVAEFSRPALSCSTVENKMRRMRLFNAHLRTSVRLHSVSRATDRSQAGDWWAQASQGKCRDQAHLGKSWASAQRRLYWFGFWILQHCGPVRFRWTRVTSHQSYEWAVIKSQVHPRCVNLTMETHRCVNKMSYLMALPHISFASTDGQSRLSGE